LANHLAPVVDCHGATQRLATLRQARLGIPQKSLRNKVGICRGACDLAAVVDGHGTIECNSQLAHSLLAIPEGNVSATARRLDDTDNLPAVVHRIRLKEPVTARRQSHHSVETWLAVGQKQYGDPAY